MANVVVVGSQWGDEGKGKIVDWLSEQADIVVRFQGGHNAGHTLVIDGTTYKLSLLPTGILSPHMRAVIGNGVVVNPVRFHEEVSTLRAAGIPVLGVEPAANVAEAARAKGIRTVVRFLGPDTGTAPAGTTSPTAAATGAATPFSTARSTSTVPSATRRSTGAAASTSTRTVIPGSMSPGPIRASASPARPGSPPACGMPPGCRSRRGCARLSFL